MIQDELDIVSLELQFLCKNSISSLNKKRVGVGTFPRCNHTFQGSSLFLLIDS